MKKPRSRLKTLGESLMPNGIPMPKQPITSPTGFIQPGEPTLPAQDDYEMPRRRKPRYGQTP